MFSHAQKLLLLNCSGAAEEATAVFGEAAALSVEKQYSHQASATQNSNTSNEDHNVVPAKNFGLEDLSSRQLKHMQGNNLRDISGNYHGTSLLSGAATQTLNGSSSNMSFYNTPSPMASQVR